MIQFHVWHAGAGRHEHEYSCGKAKGWRTIKGNEGAKTQKVWKDEWKKKWIHRKTVKGKKNNKIYSIRERKKTSWTERLNYWLDTVLFTSIACWNCSCSFCSCSASCNELAVIRPAFSMDSPFRIQPSTYDTHTHTQKVCLILCLYVQETDIIWATYIMTTCWISHSDPSVLLFTVSLALPLAALKHFHSMWPPPSPLSVSSHAVYFLKYVFKPYTSSFSCISFCSCFNPSCLNVSLRPFRFLLPLSINPSYLSSVSSLFNYYCIPNPLSLTQTHTLLDAH